ncbi:hypothetical protein M413DRAFT_440764 [Hebeloma cylindrosporum]|uniref:Uncharacterized protein n=1 Tax=Hebeloma cylindrosporum TaxID=76867 RepID=A0A0C2YBU8_HEBCY|nr:hypothetical protein M413DRAFT_440764 [Hebeloma cylindrosporum h7]
MTTPLNIPPPSCEGDLSRWILEFENAQNMTARPRSQWAGQAIIELKGAILVGSELREIRRLRHGEGILAWPWDEFKAALRKLVVARDKKIRRLKAIAGIIGGGIALFPSVVVAAGFTAGGVAAGSLAASIQSAFYGGATTGLFSLLQSVGATAAPAAAGTVLSAVGSIVAGTTVLGSGDDDDSDEDDDNRAEP